MTLDSSRPTHIFPDYLLWLALLALATAAATILVLIVVQFTWYSLADVLCLLLPLTVFLVLALTVTMLRNLRRDSWSTRDLFVVVTAVVLFFPFVCFPFLFLVWVMLGGAFANGTVLG
jgi:hypothetical protein